MNYSLVYSKLLVSTVQFSRISGSAWRIQGGLVNTAEFTVSGRFQAFGVAQVEVVNNVLGNRLGVEIDKRSHMCVNFG